MLKLFVTGDNHFGKKYNRYPEIRDQLIQSRFDSFGQMIRRAEDEGCGLFVVTGDLFDNINTIKIADVKAIVNMLSSFGGTVLVLPGNHDYYTGDEKVWKDFMSAAADADNILLLNEYRPYELELGEEKVVIYPAFCQSKHSDKNNLDWIKETELQKEGVINLGIAHGAIKGVTPDMHEEYFLMAENELAGIPLDAWLIGHTHITYPYGLEEETETNGYRIFNAGTHEQLDLHNRTEGAAFIICIDKDGAAAKVTVRKIITGAIRFYDLAVRVSGESETSLRAALTEAFSQAQDKSIVRVRISGVVGADEYAEKNAIYQEVLGRFLSFEAEDSELSEKITLEKIRSEYAETSFAAKFLEQLIDHPTELQMAYQLMKECKEH